VKAEVYYYILKLIIDSKLIVIIINIYLY